MNAANQSAGRRLTLITIDQAIAGASNVLVAVLAARLLGVASFGLFGVVFLIATMALGVSRALVCDPLLIHPAEAQERRGEVLGTGFLLGLGLAAVLAAVGLGIDIWVPELGRAVLVLSCGIPLLVLQDLGRYLGFALGRPAFAVVLDAVWLVLVVATMAGLVVTDHRTLAWFVGAWGASGAAAGLLVLTQHGAWSVRPSSRWLRYTWPFSWRYLLSYTSNQAGALGTVSGVGVIAGARSLGGFQGAVLLVRPFATFQVAAIASGVAEISRAAETGPALRRRAVRICALPTVIAVLNTVVILVLPDRLGEAVLGSSWQVATPLLLPTGLQIIFVAVTTGVRAALLGSRQITKVVGIDVVSTLVAVGATVVGALADGVRGAVWYAAVGLGALTVVWWTVLIGQTKQAAARPVGRHRRGSVAPAPVAGPLVGPVVEPAAVPSAATGYSTTEAEASSARGG